jgi:hypothetical protein
MCITIHQFLLAQDDPNASLAFDRDTLTSRSATTSDTANCAGSCGPPVAAMTCADGTVKEAEHGDIERRPRLRDGDTMSMATEVLRNG